MKRPLVILAAIYCLFWAADNLHASEELAEYAKRMTLRQKVGQLLMLGIQGRNLSTKEIEHIRKINPGGIVFYGRNVKEATDIAPLVSKIRSISGDPELPIFFAVDQEGGLVHRIEGELYRPPSEPAIGAANSVELSREAGLSVGSALKDLGINVNLSPVLDVPADILSSPMARRSFSNNSGTVARLGTAYILGLREAGLLATAKHFPGLGRANEDSHFGIPHIVWKNLEERDKDTMPFESAIRAGVDIVMIGHFIAEPGDSENPISLSAYWMEDVLRKDMAFEGLILVDNIEMRAIKGMMSVSEAAVQSFRSGADIIMVSHEMKNQEKVFNALMDAVKKGRISHRKLHESLTRIMKAKARVMKAHVKMPGNDLDRVTRSVAEASIAYLRLKDVPPLPIGKESSALYIGYNSILLSGVKDFFSHAETLNTTLLNYRKLNPETPIDEFLAKFDAVIMDAEYTDAAEIISACNKLNKEYIVILGQPGRFQKIIGTLHPRRIVLTFENTRVHLGVALEMISGIRQAKGRLPFPLSLPDVYVYY
jgi:beta-N-acetylhexosaminidase